VHQNWNSIRVFLKHMEFNVSQPESSQQELKMEWKTIYNGNHRTSELADALFQEQKNNHCLGGWFRVLEIQMEASPALPDSCSLETRAALLLKAVAAKLPLTISDHAVFAGSQNDAFSSSYALIHPSFKVEEFKGYCDPLGVFQDLSPEEGMTEERIESVKQYYARTDYVKDLKNAYLDCSEQTEEALFFVEQVTGHLIPDFSRIIRLGTEGMKRILQEKLLLPEYQDKQENLKAMLISLEAMEILSRRYRDIALTRLEEEKNPLRRKEWELMAHTLVSVPEEGAKTLYEAIQVYILCWETMCLEQCPNPYAFSAGNIDRLFEPYRHRDNADRESAAGLFQALLAFYNVGDRSWAISQNLLLSGRNLQGEDLTNESSYAILDAFYKGRYPQPILSMRLHKETPEELYRSTGRFFFTPGQLTPSLFNDDSMLPILLNQGFREEDVENYAIAGCQEPLITGKDNGNTTNSWLNLAKVLEVTLNRGCSTITGRKIAKTGEELSGEVLSDKELLTRIHELYYLQLESIISTMTEAADNCSHALSHLRVPFLSISMGGLESGIDLRDDTRQGTLYNGSGCLIHGLSILADSFQSLSDFADSKNNEECGRLLKALKNDFKEEEPLRQYLLTSPKFGNNIPSVDEEAIEIIARVSDRIRARKNYLGNPFRPDWSSPSTHLLYGYWTGATPDGRKARTMLGYGIDPLFGEASSGLNSRILSLRKLPYEKMNGGCACHLGINPAHFPEESLEDKGFAFSRKVVEPLFNLQSDSSTIEPFYLYVNVTTADTLRKLLKQPEKYAPSGVYIMRIHGTFVNFLDLSPAIQEDIILRLET
jgi:pyruvate-formate lyase